MRPHCALDQGVAGQTEEVLAHKVMTVAVGVVNPIEIRVLET